jgi:hypothetical protein
MFANQIGSLFVINIPKQQIEENLNFGIFLIEYLSSYEHMGTLEIYFYSSIPIAISNNNNNTDKINNIMKCKDIFKNKEITKSRVDSLHKQKVSVMSTLQLQINKTSKIEMIYLCFEIVQASPLRKENKISIKSITFF